MDIDCIFNILLLLNVNIIIKCISINKLVKNLDTEYLWKLLCERDYKNICCILDIEHMEHIKSVNYIEKCKYIEKYKYCDGLLKLKHFLNYEGTIEQLYKEKRISCNKIHETLHDRIITELTKLNNLEDLCLSNCKLQSISNNIGKLTKLKYLSLDENKLTSIPSEIDRLINLKELSIDENNISYLPKELYKLINLKFLLIDNSPVVFSPKEIKQLKQLKQLNN